MNGADDSSPLEAAVEKVEAARPPDHRRRWFPSSAPGWIILISVVAVMIVATVAVGVRFGLNTVPGLAFVEAQANGLKIGRYGKLKIEGVSGDIWRNVSIRRVIIYDEKGTWLEGRNLNMKWRYHELFVRRFHADAIAAEQITLIRQPTLTPKEKSGALPVTILIDALSARIDSKPAFSQVEGRFDLTGRLALQRGGGGTAGRFTAKSLMHQGDFADVTFDLGRSDALLVNAKASEARGGALAGALGLDAGQPFALDAQASGTTKVGQFKLLVTSGTSQPAKADGSWNAQGGAANGYVRLDASRLTGLYAKLFGPQVKFDVAGKKGQGDFYDLNARLDSETLSVTAVGPANLGKQLAGPGGLAVTANTPSIERLSFGAVKGQANFIGRFNGQVDAFTLKGDARGANVSVAGFTLASASGPVTVARTKGEIGIVTSLAGAGGRGQGYLAALLGPRPTADGDIAILNDGRVLLKRVRANGAGLKVDASGSRNLFGGLSFNGKAELWNFGAAKFGGKGRLAGSWSANQSGEGKPWVFSVDAKGTGLALGVSELDRLLGAAPRLRGKASLQPSGQVDVAEARLDGDKAFAKGTGRLGAKGDLAFKLDWNAEGPFRIGPVEVAGKAKGDGTIGGSLSAPRADLTAKVDQIDLPRLPLRNANLTLTFMQRPGGGGGAFSITADSQYGPAKLRTDFAFTEGGANLTGLDADAGGIKAQGAVSLRRGRPSSADLVLAIGPGVVLTEGSIAGTAKIIDASGGARATLNLTAKDAVLRDAAGLTLDTATITADGPLDRLPLRIQASGAAPNGSYSLDVAGILTEQPQAQGWQLTADGSGKLGRTQVRTTETARLAFGGPVTEAHLKLAATGGRAAANEGGGGGTADIDARIAKGSADITADITGLPLAAINEDLAGRADAKLSLRGQGETLTGALDATVKNVRARGSGKTLTLDGTVQARLNDRAITIEANASSAQGLKANGSFVLPAEASAAPLRLAIDRRRPAQGKFHADGEIKPLWDLLMGGDRALSGQVALDGTLGGTLADPRLLGEGTLSNGTFEDGPTGIKLRNVSLAAAFADNAIDIRQVSATDPKGGKASGAGRISLLREGTSSFRLDLTKFQVIDNDLAEATASGQVTINRTAAGNPRVEGSLRIDRAEIAAEPLSPSGVTPMDVVEINKPRTSAARRAEAEAAQKERGATVELAVDLRAPRGLFVRGRGLDVEMSLDANVSGTTAHPVLTGTARVVRGEYDFAGKRFEFDERGSVTLSTDPSKIRLNLTATREDPAITAVIKVEGTAAKPEITLTSSPQLPQDEVLSRVLFGSSAAQLSPYEAAQLASALAALAGGGGFDVIGNVRELAGLDRLTIGGTEVTGVTVAGGKYLTNDVYLELIGGGREGGAVQVEWRVRKNLSLVSRIAGSGESKLSVRWRRDY